MYRFEGAPRDPLKEGPSVPEPSSNPSKKRAEPGRSTRSAAVATDGLSRAKGQKSDWVYRHLAATQPLIMGIPVKGVHEGTTEYI